MLRSLRPPPERPLALVALPQPASPGYPLSQAVLQPGWMLRPDNQAVSGRRSACPGALARASSPFRAAFGAALAKEHAPRLGPGYLPPSSSAALSRKNAHRELPPQGLCLALGDTMDQMVLGFRQSLSAFGSCLLPHLDQAWDSAGSAPVSWRMGCLTSLRWCRSALEGLCV